MDEGSNWHRIAILPLANVSPDPADSYFADGLTDELISTASKIGELDVISRTSSMQYKNRPKSIKRIAKELNVATILEGSVRKAGNRVRITIQMIDAKHDRQLWVESYDREVQDVFAIQSEVAQRVAETLSVKLLSGEKRDIEKTPTKSPEAYTLYLKGRYYFGERTKDSMDKAVEYFEEAVRRDPAFALAYAGLADCFAAYPNRGWMMSREAYSKARIFVSKAFEIDPRLAEPHTALGYILAMYDYKWHDAESEFKLAEELKPSYATAYHWYSLILRGMGRFVEAFQQIKRASELDPLSAVIRVNVAEVLLVFGKVKEAIDQCESLIEANPDFVDAYRILGWACFLDSRINEAILQVKKAITLSRGDVGGTYRTDLACLLGFAGRRDEANMIIRELEDLAKTTYVNSVMMAYAYFGAGRVDEAFMYLERGLGERSDVLVEISWWPWLKGFQKDPRWTSIESRMRLTRNVRDDSSANATLEPLEESEFHGTDDPTKILFDFLVEAFIEDYMKKRLYIEQSGWRSLTQMSKATKIPQGALYGRQGHYGATLNELRSKGLVEFRTFTGHRGRGGSAIKVRIAYDREPTKRYVDRLALKS